MFVWMRTGVAWNISFIFISFVNLISARILLLVDEYSQDWSKSFQEGLADYQDAYSTSLDYKAIVYRNESHWPEVCQYLSNGITLVLDLTKRIGDPETKPQKFFTSKFVPYFKVDMPFEAVLRSVDALLQVNNGSNGFFIFNSNLGLNRGVNTILGTTIIRYAFLQYPEQENLITEKFEYRVPSAVTLIGTESQLREFVVKRGPLVRNRTEWIFMFDEFIDSTSPPKFDSIKFPYFRGFVPISSCCALMLNTKPDDGLGLGQSCGVASCRESPSQLFLRRLAFLIMQTLKELDSSGGKVVKITCTGVDGTGGGQSDKEFTGNVIKSLNTKAGNPPVLLVNDGRIRYNLPVILEDFVNGEGKLAGEYTLEKGLDLDPKFVFRPRKRYFRIGIVESSPWTMWDKEKKQWAGYCIDLAAGLASKMDFEYDLILSKEFGKRVPPHGRWDGLTGDLIHGKIDIAVAPYIMTSEREIRPKLQIMLKKLSEGF